MLLFTFVFWLVLYVMQNRVRFFLSILITLFHINAIAQQGNEWINFGQVYYRIPVGKDGIYRITKSDLEQAGFPVGLDPRRYQLFAKGAEQARFIAGQEDAIFNDGDYIEFFGRRNDGSQDNALYRNPAHQPHAYTALYNDTTYYYLTFNPLIQGKRLQTFFETNAGSLPKEVAQETERITVNTTSYSAGETAANVIQLTQFDAGEGWSGPVIREGNFTDISLTGFSNAVPAQGLPQIELQILGRSAGNHKAEIWIGPTTANLRLLQTISFTGFQPFTLSQALQFSDISAGGSVTIRMQVVATGAADFISLSYARVTMPQNFSLTNLTERYVTLYPNVNGKSYVEFDNTPANTRIYDVTNVNDTRQIGTQGSSTISAIIDNTQLEKRKLFATNVINTIAPAAIRRITFRSFQSVTPDFVIITHRQFLRPAAGYPNPVKSYAAYRASTTGGGYDTLTVTIDQLYNQFTYGEATPLAIKRFLKFLETKKRPD
ncbi:MAG: C25 family cysteine peptidase, partial [Cyclobacteriaceae bacterium]|nr:C25 family cysteine peptidase [Cyclobacteriaceae bacterium]